MISIIKLRKAVFLQPRFSESKAINNKYLKNVPKSKGKETIKYA